MVAMVRVALPRPGIAGAALPWPDLAEAPPQPDLAGHGHPNVWLAVAGREDSNIF